MSIIVDVLHHQQSCHRIFFAFAFTLDRRLKEYEQMSGEARRGFVVKVAQVHWKPSSETKDSFTIHTVRVSTSTL